MQNTVRAERAEAGILLNFMSGDGLQETEGAEMRSWSDTATGAIGKKFNRLTVLRAVPDAAKYTYAVECRCDCGTLKVVRLHALMNGTTQSCGCVRRAQVSARNTARNTKHGMTGTYTYITWRKMIERCFTPAARAYERYGARGITVCERWREFGNFLADMGERPAGTTIDRIDSRGNYEPGNCRWATIFEQNSHLTRRPKLVIKDAAYYREYRRKRKEGSSPKRAAKGAQ